MSDIAVGPGRDLAETPPRTCSRAVAQNNRSPPGQQKAITTGEGNRLRNPFHTQPAVAARKHRKVRQICGRHLFVGRRDFFFGLLLLYYAPWAVASSLCRPKAVTCIVLKMSVIGSNLASLFWTNRQKIRTPEQFSSTAKELYSTGLNSTDLPTGVMGKLQGKVAVVTGDRAVWR